MTSIAIFASGSGSNALNIIEYFKKSTKVKVALLVTNNPKARVNGIAQSAKIPLFQIEKSLFYQSEKEINDILNTFNIDFIALAGFLWLIPNYLIEKYPNKIVNIHPSLLPDYGGKGMYGMHVHKAVIKNKEKKSGMTIHIVNQEFDKGKILFQKRININQSQSPENIQSKIIKLEHKYYGPVIENYLSNLGL